MAFKSTSVAAVAKAIFPKLGLSQKATNPGVFAGAWGGSGAVLAKHSPIDGSLLATFSGATANDVSGAVQAAAAAFTTWPNSALSKSPSTDAGPKNWAWLKVLKLSSRNCSALTSENLKLRNSARSKLSSPGPAKERRDALPGVPSALSLKADTLR